jgi:hypothetical protein
MFSPTILAAVTPADGSASALTRLYGARGQMASIIARKRT